jgi:hypothetical protein
LLTAAAAELDARSDQHDVPEDSVAVGLTPNYLPSVEMTSDRNRGRHAEELGFETVFHGPCGRSSPPHSQVWTASHRDAPNAHPEFGTVMLVPQQYDLKLLFMPKAMRIQLLSLLAENS